LHRRLVVIADDFGIGTKTSEGIIHLAQKKDVLSGAVLLANSPYAESAMNSLAQSQLDLAVGWHPNLTLDKPILNCKQVPSLVDKQGKFFPLHRFISKWLLGQFNHDEIFYELEAQLLRFKQLTGSFPTFINSHQHIAVFSPVGEKLNLLLQKYKMRPWVRRVGEETGSMLYLPGSRLKRFALSFLGKAYSKKLDALGFPGASTLAGLCDPLQTASADFYASRLKNLQSDLVEWMCHPGFFDPSLIGRDGNAYSPSIQMRPNELQFLVDGTFQNLANQNKFRILSSAELRNFGKVFTNAA